MIIKMDNLDRHMARLTKRLEVCEDLLGRPKFNADSTAVVGKASKAGRKAKGGKVVVRKIGEPVDPLALDEVEDEVETKIDGRKKRTYTDEERKAIGVRLQTARAKNLGLTYDEFKSLRLRPGAKPTDEQMAEIEAARATSKPKKTAAKKRPTKKATK